MPPRKKYAKVGVYAPPISAARRRQNLLDRQIQASIASNRVRALHASRSMADRLTASRFADVSAAARDRQRAIAEAQALTFLRNRIGDPWTHVSAYLGRGSGY